MLVGTSRSREHHESLTAEISALCPALLTKFLSIELDDVDAMPEIFSECLDVNVQAFDAAVLIHNAGDAGDFTISCKESSDARALQKSLGLNMTSPVLLTGAFLRRFDGSPCKLYVVNISSLLAIEAFPGFHQYAMMKAGRDMFLRVLAKEQALVRCLNWAPGPMPTDMYNQLCDGAHSADVRDSFSKMRDEKTYVTCEHSAAKLMDLLRLDAFESGAHIDIYDV